MKRIILICSFIVLSSIPFYSQGSVDHSYNELEQAISVFFDQGDYVNAERTALNAFRYADSKYHQGVILSHLARVYLMLERFSEAKVVLKNMLDLDLPEYESRYILSFAYQSLAIIYERERSYYQAIEYMEKAIRICKSNIGEHEYFIESLIGAYHNLGGYYIEMGHYSRALPYLRLSLELRNEPDVTRNNRSTYLGFARVYAGMNDIEQAEKYFRMCVESGKDSRKSSDPRLAQLYYEYGEYLKNSFRFSEAAAMIRNGLEINCRIFGEKNNQTSRGYSLLAESLNRAGSSDSALFYYQKSLISIVDNFNNQDISVNPSIDSSILDVRLMDNLKGKAVVLETLAQKQHGDERLNTLNLGLSTIMLAIDLIDIVRNNYPTEETMMYIAGHEKETYMSALRIASAINQDLGDNSFTESMYSIALRAKAGVLRNQITGIHLLHSPGVPDSLRDRQLTLSANISGYNKLILDESGRADPDTMKINMWKDAVFEMKLEKEKLSNRISQSYPRYAELLVRTDPVPPQNIRNKLAEDELLLDYFISKEYSEGKRKLYLFLVSRDNLRLIEHEVDSMFSLNASSLSFSDPALKTPDIRTLTSSLHYFYKNLIYPAEKFICCKKVIIVPDEEINRLPFEAFIRKPPAGNQADFDGVEFLLNDYAFSYAYSASLLPARTRISKKGSVTSFLPSYDIESGYNSLDGAIQEINNINSITGGRSFNFGEATRENFLGALKDSAILHLAMHSVKDTLNSLYSYLLFSPHGNEDSARLYNYEVSLSTSNSPMIVLSSCSSGSGILYSGEGQLSLARSFILAGASSVVRTTWDVNDQSGSEIITRFYHYLVKGKDKDEALRLAKSDFLKSAPPAMRNPYYWAAYEIVGDNGKVIRNNRGIVTFVTILVAFLVALLVYFNRRRILAARSL